MRKISQGIAYLALIGSLAMAKPVYGEQAEATQAGSKQTAEAMQAEGTNSTTEATQPNNYVGDLEDVFKEEKEESVLHFAAEGGMRIFFDDNGTDVAASTSISGKVGYDTGFFGRLRLGFIDTLTSGDLPDAPRNDPSVGTSLSKSDGFGNTGALTPYEWTENVDYFNGFFGDIEGGYSTELGDGHLSVVVSGGVLRHHKDQRQWNATKLSSYDPSGTLIAEDPQDTPEPNYLADTDVVVPALQATIGAEGKYEGFTFAGGVGMVWDTDGSETRKGTVKLLLRYEF
jgi:hypothetical protein